MSGTFFTSLLDFLFPPLCHVCRSFIPQAGSIHICPSCMASIRNVPHPLCPVCGVPFEDAGADHPCGACITAPPPFDAARGALIYSGHCRDLIHRFKYSYKTHLRRPLGLLACQGLTEFAVSVAPDVIVPVPLHRARLAKRGFNQAILLGELMARQWRIPLLRQALRRDRDTLPQVNLSAEERLANVRGAFSVDPQAQLSGRRILLVDDVFTTGSTAAECARMLKKSGAAGVYVITVARAVNS